MLFDFLRSKENKKCPKCGQQYLSTIEGPDRSVYVHSLRRGRYKGSVKRMGYAFKWVSTPIYEELPQGCTAMKDSST
jgi:hypothetical protein